MRFSIDILEFSMNATQPGEVDDRCGGGASEDHLLPRAVKGKQVNGSSVLY